MKHYEWRLIECMEVISWKHTYFKADAKKAYDEINALKEVTAENVVNLARNENSEIHNDFEWNDSIAGEKYRLIQAGHMIRSFVIENKETNREPIRAFEISTTPTVYKPIQIIIKHEDEYQNLLKRAKAEFKSMRKRYETLSELENVFSAIDDL